MGTPGLKERRGVRVQKRHPGVGRAEGMVTLYGARLPERAATGIGRGGQKRRLETESRGSDVNQESEEGTNLTQAEPVGPSVGEGTLVGKWSQAHSEAPMS